jgi:DNA-directed RNA polymerase specialized sigma24 family protein
VTIAHRKSIDQLRGAARRSEPARELPELAVPEPAPADDDELRAALDALPPKQRGAVIYRYLAELSYAEVGEIPVDHCAALDALPPKQRGAVIYRYLAELSYAEVGNLLGSNATAARRSAADGIASLRKHLSKGTS